MKSKARKAFAAIAVFVLFAPFVRSSLAEATPDPYRNAVLASDPLAYWPLDEGGGVVIDVSAHGHDGAPLGAPGYGEGSLLPSGEGSAVHVSQGSRFEIPAFEKFSPGSTGYTVEYWVKVNVATSYYTQVVGDGVSGGSFYMMQYLENYAPGQACPRPHYGYNNGLWDPSPCTIGALFTFGVPHHVVVTWDRPSGVVQIYIDGQQFTQNDKPSGLPAGTDLQMWLGHDDREPGWDLILDEVAFWDRALTQQEVQGHIDAANVVPPPVFSGFFAPVENQLVNGAKAGQAIPLKWRLLDANGPVSDPASFVSLTSVPGSGACAGPPIDAIEEYVSSSGLQYLGDGYWQFNWKTPKSYAGQCRTMRLNLNDQVPHTAAFQFK